MPNPFLDQSDLTLIIGSYVFNRFRLAALARFRSLLEKDPQCLQHCNDKLLTQLVDSLSKSVSFSSRDIDKFNIYQMFVMLVKLAVQSGRCEFIGKDSILLWRKMVNPTPSSPLSNTEIRASLCQEISDARAFLKLMEENPQLLTVHGKAVLSGSKTLVGSGVKRGLEKDQDKIALNSTRVQHLGRFNKRGPFGSFRAAPQTHASASPTASASPRRPMTADEILERRKAVAIKPNDGAN
jgi:hypothetical protein